MLRDLMPVILLIIGLLVIGSLLRTKGGLGSFIPSVSQENRFGGTSIRQGNSNQNEPDKEDALDDTPVDIKDLRESFNKIKNLSNSRYKDFVSISSHRGQESDVSKERVEIRVKRDISQKIPISSWRLESALTKQSFALGNGAYLPYSATVNTESHIFLSGGEKAIITTGRSPIGVSFRLNKCTGYFEQFQNFTPSLPLQCPKPVDDLPNLGSGDSADACFDFVNRLPRCQIYLKSVPGNLDGACFNYISREINYNTCVSKHKDDPDFYTGEWRIYLGRSQDVWKERREIIKLIDHEGKVVDAITY